MITFYNFSKKREGDFRIYKAEFLIGDKKHQITINERYTFKGAAFTVTITPRPGLLRKFKIGKKVPYLTQTEWYRLYFQQQNRQN